MDHLSLATPPVMIHIVRMVCLFSDIIDPLFNAHFVNFGNFVYEVVLFQR